MNGANLLQETSAWMDTVDLALCLFIYEVCNDCQFEFASGSDFVNFMNLKPTSRPVAVRPKENLRVCYMVLAVSRTIRPHERGKLWAEEFLKRCGISKSYYDKHRSDVCSGETAGNFTLLGDLLARMALTTEEAKGFRRPLMLSAGQAQYSEEQLSAQWNIGRKRIRNLLDELTRLGLIDTCRSRVASVMTFPCIRQWTAADGSTVSNPFTHTNKGEG